MFNKIFNEKGWVRNTLVTLGLVFIVLIIFQAGRFVGFHQARMAFGMGAQYYRVFEGGRGGGFPRDGFPGAHGAVGEVVSINLPAFVVKGGDNVEKTILLNDMTEIQKFRATASSTDITINDFVTVLGEPNDSAQIEARFIRILPPPPQR